MRCVGALELRPRGAELVVEHGGALLLVAQHTELGPCVVELGLGGAELRLCRLGGLAGVQRVHVCRVEVLLELAGAGRPGRERLGFAPGDGELCLRTLELGPQSDRVLVDLLEPGELLGVGQRLRLGAQLQQILHDLVALGLEGQHLPLEGAGPALGLQRTLLELGIRAERLRHLAGRELGCVELLQRLAVLLLEDLEAVFRGPRAILRAPPRLGLLADTRRGRLERRPRLGDRKGRTRLGAALGLGEAHVGCDGVAQALHPNEQEPDDHQHEHEEQGVRAPRTGGGGDRVVGAGQLDGCGVADARWKLERRHHGEGAVDVLGLGVPLDRRLDPVPHARQRGPDPADVGGEQDVSVLAPQRDRGERARARRSPGPRGRPA